MAIRKSQLSEEARFRILRLLDDNPNLSQRDLARGAGVSVGTAHYVLNALIERGMVKIARFRASDDKRRYAYVLTPKGQPSCSSSLCERSRNMKRSGAKLIFCVGNCISRRVAVAASRPAMQLSQGKLDDTRGNYARRLSRSLSPRLERAQYRIVR